MAKGALEKKLFTTRELTYIPILTAVTAVLSQIMIPLPFTPIPINLGTLAVFLSGGILGARNGAMSQILYVLLGAVGIPVFSGLRGGLGVIAGPTGGYIVGYIIGAIVIGLLISKLPSGILSNAAAMIAGLLCCYALGTLWYMLITNTGVTAALVMCVIPFLLGDALKILAAAFLVKRLKKSGI